MAARYGSSPLGLNEVIGWSGAGIVAWSTSLDQIRIINPKDGTYRAFAAHHLAFQAASSSGIWSLTGGLSRMDPETGQITLWYAFSGDEHKADRG